jgi:hypothetical protein
LPGIQGDAVRSHLQQGKIDDGAVDDRSIADAGDRDEALFGSEDALGGVEVGAGDGVNRRSVDPPQRGRFFDAVWWCGQGYRPVLENLINEEFHQRVRVLDAHLHAADLSLCFGPNMPHLPGRPGLLHNGQDVISRLCDPAGVGHARGFGGGDKCRRDHRRDGLRAVQHCCGFVHPGGALLGQ